MKKELRVKKNEEFQKIIQARHSIACKEFVLYYLNNDIEHFRIGFSVSKKLGNAVTRNRIKRQVREMTKLVFDTNKNVDYILIVRKGYLDQDFQTNCEQLRKLYGRLDKKNFKKENINVGKKQS